MAENRTNILITEYLNSQANEETKQRMRAVLIENGVSEKELQQLEEVNRLLEFPNEAEPSFFMKAKFQNMVETYKKQDSQSKTLAGIEAFIEQVIGKSFIVRTAFALIFFVAGLLIGTLLIGKSQQNAQVSSLLSEMQQTQKVLMLTLLEQPQASDRLKAISISNKLPENDDKVMNALLNTLNNDENVNVRLMALESLYGMAENPTVRMGLIHSIRNQESPIMQVALADAMVMLQEKRSIEEFRKILIDNNLNKNVKSKLEISINSLNSL